jgi:hypothetical protein
MLTMKWEDAGITMGNAEDNTFTMDNKKTPLTYQK